MTEKTICSDYIDTEQNQTTEITMPDFIIREMKFIDRLLGIIAKHDDKLIEKLLHNYKVVLNKMNIDLVKNVLHKQFVFDFTEYEWLTKYPEFVFLIENALLFFLNFPKYENKISKENKIVVLKTDAIRGEFHPLFYLVFSLVEITSREFTLELAKEFTDSWYKLNKDKIKKHETVEEYAKSLYDGLCPKNQNYVWKIEDGKYYLKTTRCMWAEVYSDLPDLELASLLECYGDFSKMPYINPNFVLSRTKTLVEGHHCCDFVYYDKRIIKNIKHPEDEFWKNF
ncbi:MAG: hypothetical protein FK731_02810 [Asgard group archaeon]|nr:hypothetical protein [Asgard group archaeon]